MIHYRGFGIEEGEFLYKNGFYYSLLSNEEIGGWDRTIRDCKERIDDYWIDRTEYRVLTCIGITKFYSLLDALAFTERFNGELKIIVDGDEAQFDTI